VRDIRDSKNPFLGQYSELDYWAYAAAGELTEEELQAYHPDSAADNYRMIRARVTDDGYIKPQLLVFRDEMKRLHGEAPASDEQSCSLTMFAVGEIDEALYASYEQEMCAVWAEYSPPVPGWLAAAPPPVAMLMSNGDVLAYGELGSELVIEEAWVAIFEPSETWRKYNADGEVLGEIPAGARWIELYAPDFNERCDAAEAQGYFCDEHNGHIVIIDQRKWDVIEAEDYLGNPVEVGEEGMWGLIPPYELISGKYLPLVHAAQNPSLE
jgi:hypothetical protein